MYLFSRRARLTVGHARDAMEWAIGQTEVAKRISGLEISLFSQVFSPQVGTMAWSAFVPDLVTLEAAGDKLNADDGFVSAADRGAAFITGGFDDTLAEVVHGAPDPARRVEYATTVRAVCRNGGVARGMEVGVEIAQRAERVTGTPTLFLAETTSSYGAVGWVTGFDDVAAMEKAQHALNADASFIEFVDREAGDVYVEDSSITTQLIFRRLA